MKKNEYYIVWKRSKRLDNSRVIVHVYSDKAELMRALNVLCLGEQADEGLNEYVTLKDVVSRLMASALDGYLVYVDTDDVFNSISAYKESLNKSLAYPIDLINNCLKAINSTLSVEVVDRAKVKALIADTYLEDTDVDWE